MYILSTIDIQEKIRNSYSKYSFAKKAMIEINCHF